MKSVSRKSAFLVAGQFLLLFLHLIIGQSVPEQTIALIMIALAVLIGIHAIWVMRLQNLSVYPERKHQYTPLIDRGIYKMIRHPMYLSLVLVFIAYLIDAFSYFRMFTFLSFLILIHFKMNHEERILKNQLPGYTNYINHTHRWLPFIY